MKGLLSDRFVTIIASGFYTGYLPVAPGSWASAAILPVGAVVHFSFGVVGLLVLSLLLLAIGLPAAKRYIDMDGRADPPEVVIDEMAAQIVVLAVVQLVLIEYLFAVVLFRLFDIFKPWPIPFIERRLSPTLALMVDDFVAGFYAMLLLAIFSFMEII